MRVALDAEGAAKSADQRIGRVFLDLVSNRVQISVCLQFETRHFL